MSVTTISKEIPVGELVPFFNHPFKLYQGKRSEALINSVRENGVLTPIIVRPKGEQYEILSGHNRVEAARQVGLSTVPATIREGLSDDEARLIVTVTNLIQRSYSDLSHSERAAALSEHHNAIKSQGRRTDILDSITTLLDTEDTSATVRHKLKAREVISKTYGISGTVVAQYLRVAKLASPLQIRLDNGEFSLRAAVELSYLTENTQNLLDKILTDSEYRLESKKANLLRAADAAGTLDEVAIKDIIIGAKGAKQKTRPVKINDNILSRHFNENETDEEISSTIEKALAAWFAQNKE